MSKDLNRHFSEDEIQIANKPTKKMFVIREMNT